MRSWLESESARAVLEGDARALRMEASARKDGRPLAKSKFRHAPPQCGVLRRAPRQLVMAVATAAAATPTAPRVLVGAASAGLADAMVNSVQVAAIQVAPVEVAADEVAAAEVAAAASESVASARRGADVTRGRNRLQWRSGGATSCENGRGCGSAGGEGGGGSRGGSDGGCSRSGRRRRPKPTATSHYREETEASTWRVGVEGWL